MGWPRERVGIVFFADGRGVTMTGAFDERLQVQHARHLAPEFLVAHDRVRPNCASAVTVVSQSWLSARSIAASDAAALEPVDAAPQLFEREGVRADIDKGGDII